MQTSEVFQMISSLHNYMHVQPRLCCFPFLWDQRFQGKVLFFFFLNWFEFIYRPPKRYSLLSLIHNRSAGKHLVPEQFCLTSYGTGKVWGHLTTIT